MDGGVHEVGRRRLSHGGLDQLNRAAGFGGASDERTATETTIATIPLGSCVHDIALSPDGEHIYVAQTDSIVVINGQHHIGARISLTGHPKRLVTGANGERLLAVDYGGSVFVVDTRDHSVRTLWAGGALDVVVSPDGRLLYVAHSAVSGGRAHGVVSVIEISSATAIGAISVDDVTALAIAPDGGCLYAVSYDRRTYYQYPTGWLAVIDTASHAVVNTIAVGACPETITVSPDGAYLHVTHYDTCSVSAVNLTTGRVTAVALSDAPLALSFTPDSAHAYVCNMRSLTVIDTATGDTEDIDTGGLPRGLQFSLDGKHGYTTDFGDRTVSVVDTTTNSITATVDVPGHPEVVAVSPDGERIYVGDYWSGAIAVISSPQPLWATEA